MDHRLPRASKVTSLPAPAVTVTDGSALLEVLRFAAAKPSNAPVPLELLVQSRWLVGTAW
jgi:hypothetical protein